MPMTEAGWKLNVVRLEEQSGADGIRTYGRYTVYRDGDAVAGLSGFICECQGPGDNTQASTPGRKRCVEKGSYALMTHSGKYASSHYTSTKDTPGVDHPLPCIRLEDRGARSFILVHPAHRPTLYLSSIGCFNPTSARTSDEPMVFADSYARVVAMLDDLKDWSGHAYPADYEVKIPGAFIVIEEADSYHPTGT
jgi:hypothetical protein